MNPPTPDSEELLPFLADGASVRLRALRASDRALVADAYRTLSPEARYQRFWSPVGELLGDAMLDRLLEQNPAKHVSWVVLDPTRLMPGMGGASWWRSAATPDEAEISLMVLDGDQHRGIGTLLLAAMWLTALRAGVRRLVGYTLPDNRPAARWMNDCGGCGRWDGHKLVFEWVLDDLDRLPATRAAADLAARLAELAPVLLAGWRSDHDGEPHRSRVQDGLQ